MIPMFKAREQEAQLKFDKLLKVKDELEKIKGELGVQDQIKIQPLNSTSFMTRKAVKNRLID